MKTRIVLTLIVAVTWASMAQALEIRIDQLTGKAGQYRIYKSSNSGRINKTGRSSNSQSAMIFDIPDQFIVGDPKNPDLLASLGKWHSSMNLPYARKGVKIFPFRNDRNLKSAIQYIALDHLLIKRPKAVKSRMTITTSDEIQFRPGATRYDTPAVCAPQKKKMERYRRKYLGNIAPQSTAAYHQCLYGINRPDLVQADRADIARIKAQKVSALDTGAPSTSYQSAINKIRGWKKSGLGSLHCGRSRYGRTPTDTATCAVCNCFNEAGTDDMLAKYLVNRTAMARSVRNPWKKKHNTFCKAVWQKDQYSWTKKPQRARGTFLKQCLDQSIKALSTQVTPNDPDHFHAKYVNPVWRYGCQRTMQVSRKHRFYKGPCYTARRRKLSMRRSRTDK